MARRRNIERISRIVDSIHNNEDNRRTFQLIGFPNEYGDYSTSVVRCVPQKIAEAMRYYGTFTDDDIRIVSALHVGNYKCWGAEKCMVVRIA